jgi:regulator of sigma E protease
MTILNVLYVILGVLLLFGAAIFFHELGHFWVALKLGMKVEEFAIGMGPKIFSWTRNGIVYSVRWIPAGGFVKLPQMVTSEALEGKNAVPVPAAPPLHKILVAFAGPFMNIVFAFAVAGVIYLVGLPVAVNPPIVGYVEPGSPEAKLGIQEGDRIVFVNGDRIKSWEDVSLATITARTNVLPVVIERNGVETTYQLTAEVNSVVGLKLLNLDPRDHPEVMEAQSGSAAEAAGLKKGDKVIAFGGVPIASREQLIGLIQKRGGEPTEIRVQRGTEKLSLSVTPREDPTTKTGRIGAVLGTSAAMSFVVQRPGPTPWTQVKDVFNKTIKTFGALLHSKQTGVGAKDLSGPVGILTILAIQVNTDYRLALSFLVLLNINLAVLNLMPVPVLDGGHIMMAIIEKIRRRPLSPKFVEYSTTAFAVLLISFMLYVSFFDIKRFSLFKSMFRRDTQIEQQQNPAENAPLAPVPTK